MRSARSVAQRARRREERIRAGKLLLAGDLLVEPNRRRCRGELHRPDCLHSASLTSRPVGRPRQPRRADAQRMRRAREAFVSPYHEGQTATLPPTRPDLSKTTNEHEIRPLSTLTNSPPRSEDDSRPTSRSWELDPIPIPTPKHGEAPERRRLINEARALIEAGVPYDPPPQYRHLFPDYVLRIQARRRAAA
jgi:hypothetical protein